MLDLKHAAYEVFSPGATQAAITLEDYLQILIARRYYGRDKRKAPDQRSERCSDQAAGPAEVILRIKNLIENLSVRLRMTAAQPDSSDRCRSAQAQLEDTPATS